LAAPTSFFSAADFEHARLAELEAGLALALHFFRKDFLASPDSFLSEARASHEPEALCAFAVKVNVVSVANDRANTVIKYFIGTPERFASWRNCRRALEYWRDSMIARRKCPSAPSHAYKSTQIVHLQRVRVAATHHT
jgi:hypothetical protein